MSGLIALALLASCGRSAEVRYRVTYEVEDNGKPITASSVWSIRISEGWPATSYNAKFRGEAIVLDIPNKGPMFGLLTARSEQGGPAEGYLEKLPFDLFASEALAAPGPKLGLSDSVGILRRIAKMVGASKDLDCASDGHIRCPFLVTFSNINDPMSVKEVDPTNLAQSFGPRVSLKRVYVTITDEALTTGKLPPVPWLKLRGARLDGSRIGNKSTLTNILSPGAFGSEN